MQAAVKRLAVTAWITGYVTGAATVSNSPLRETTGQGIEQATTTYCEAQPDRTVEEASAALVRDLSR